MPVAKLPKTLAEEGSTTTIEFTVLFATRKSWFRASNTTPVGSCRLFTIPGLSNGPTETICNSLGELAIATPTTVSVGSAASATGPAAFSAAGEDAVVVRLTAKEFNSPPGKLHEVPEQNVLTA